MRALFLSLALCAAWGDLSAAETAGQTYTHDYFHFSIGLPAGFKTCPGPAYAPGYSIEHGFTLIAPSQTCDHDDIPPAFGVDVDFNTIPYDSLAEYAQEECNAHFMGGQSTLRTTFDGLSVPGQKSLICETELPNGVVRFSVMTLVSQERPNSNEYVFKLFTTRARYAKDVVPFRQMLKTFRLIAYTK